MTEQRALVALAGNPNVGKSTVFNALTGGKQHTGNWPGKTVGVAEGDADANGIPIRLADLPGTYALHAHSPEEAVARDFICEQKPDAVILVCDAGCLERNLNLVLQTLELTPRAVLCLNLTDEAEKNGISVRTEVLAEQLGIPVVATAAREGKGLHELMQAVRKCMESPPKRTVRVAYPREMEEALDAIQPMLHESATPRADAIRFLSGEYPTPPALAEIIASEREKLIGYGYGEAECQMAISRANVQKAEEICAKCVRTAGSVAWMEKLDRILTDRRTGIPIMFGMLFVLFWLTVSGANLPSECLGDLLERLGEALRGGLLRLGASDFVIGLCIDGIYGVSARVISVMLPPMAIFFPLFTILEDAGILTRIAFNLDWCFQRARTCGKQALTMCMGLGCNAVGVTGCRIIDSPREQKIAMLTNAFIPCNGKYPALIALLSLYFGAEIGAVGSALVMTGLITLCVLMTVLVSGLLSKTLLKGEPTAFALELPPYRKPQFGKIIVRSLLDRTLFVLGRAVSVAAPAGACIWLLANGKIGGTTGLQWMIHALEPVGRVLGMDGTVMTAFLLGFPANEIVLPICALAYQGTHALGNLSAFEMKALFDANGWTVWTAASAMAFFLFHWPCSTTVLTVKKESGSGKWAAWAILLPTVCGIAFCILLRVIRQIFAA